MRPEGAPDDYHADYDDGSYASHYLWVDDEGNLGLNINVNHPDYDDARLSLGELNHLIAALITARTFMENYA